MWRSAFIGYISVCSLALGCKKNDPVPNDPAPTGSELVYVLNEGNFGWGEATITAYQPDSMKTFSSVYHQRNNAVLGNVLQSATRLNHSIAWVVNNSGKVVITDNDLNHLGEITGLRSPRMLVQVNNHFVISDLYQRGIYIVDTASLNVVQEVSIPGWTEEMVLVEDHLWVTCPESESVYTIQIDSWTLTDSVKVGMGNHSIQLDANGQLWCRYFGEFGAGKDTAGVVQIDPITLKVEPIFTWGSEQQLPVYLSMNATKDTVYFMQKGSVLRSAINNPASAEELIHADGRNAYAFRFEPKLGNIYYSDVLDFVTPSMVYRYDRSGQLLDQFEAGIVATDFLF